MDFDDFEESEVMFSDYSSSDESVESSDETEADDPRRKHYSQSNHPRIMLKSLNSHKLKPRISSSMPVNIPVMSSLRYGIDPFNESDNDDDDDDNEDRMRRLPPHLIVERRDNEEIARSFSPLKGKYLCEARNSILRMTGFLER